MRIQNLRRASCAALVSTACLLAEAGAQSVTITGEQKLWHKVALTLNGPSSNEGASPNPFTNFRMDVTFTHSSGTSFVVPGFFAAGGNAANASGSGANSGNKWRAYLRPSKTGTWTYDISFRQGANVAMGSPNSGNPLSPYNGVSGSFSVDATDKSGRDLRSKGRLQYVGKHHLRFQGNGEYFLKFGPDSPENFLAYDQFDNTPNNGNKGRRHSYNPHSGDFNNDGQTWQGGKGRNILGAVNYLASQGNNSVSMLLYSANGDDNRVFPYTSINQKFRFDCSKLDQWEIVMDHIEAKGMHLHFKLSETENDQDHDNGNLGNQRKLYYREMIARFGHHLALNWNISEEISLTEAQTRAALEYFESNDPWQSNRVFHTFPNQSNRYSAFLGDPEMTGVSLQIGSAINSPNNVFNQTKTWIDRSRNNGRPWVVANDEQGPANQGVNQSFNNTRENVLWGNIMAGGAGVEYYTGPTDQSLENFRDFANIWRWSRFAITDFFKGQNIPFWDMRNNDGLVSNNSARCLAKAGDTYVVYLRNGGSTNLNLGGQAGNFSVRWFDPRNGGGLRNGNVTSVSGGGNRSLGNPPNSAGSDWAILVKSSGGSPPPTNTPPTVSWASPTPGADEENVAPTIAVTVTASDEDGIRTIALSIDGQAVRNENIAPYNWSGTTNDPSLAGLSNGLHTLTAVAEDNTGMTTTITRTFTVGTTPANTPPSAAWAGGTPAAGATGVASTISTQVNASDSDGIADVSLSIDGQAVRTDNVAPYRWNGAQDTALAGLSNGRHTLRAVATDRSGRSTTITRTFTVGSVGDPGGNQSPFGGTPRNLASKIEAEDFDEGGQGISYNDTDSGNNGPSNYRSGESVDLENRTNSANGVNVGWITQGEWLEYTVDAIAGRYDAEIRVASANSNPGNLKVELDGSDLGTFPIVSTGSWGTWTVLKLDDVAATGGNGKVLRLTAVDGGSFNLDWIRFSPAGGGSPQTITASLTDDAYLEGSSPFNNTLLKVQPGFRTVYLKFNTTGGSGTVTGGKLKLRVNTDPGNGTIRVYKGLSNSWTETNLNTANASARGAELGSITGTFSKGSLVEIDLGPQVGSGVTTLILTMDSGGNDTWFSSDEGSTSPQFQVTFQP